jgi:hypothetical protein
MSNEKRKINIGQTLSKGFDIAKDVKNVGMEGMGTYFNVATLAGEGDQHDPLKTAINKTSAVTSLAQTGAEVGGKVASKVGTEALKTTAGSAVKVLGEKVNPVLTIASSVKDVFEGSHKKTATQKAGAVGTGALAANTLLNFWNPSGWVSGAAMIGSMAAQMFGGSKFKPGRFK